jgi:choline kinase
VAPNVIILNAGQGRRLLPLTRETPKCLVDVGGRPMMAWQLQILSQFELGRVSVVLGFSADKVNACLEAIKPPTLDVRTIYNPDYDKADNLVSCWAAREEMSTDFILLNGDTLFEPAVFGHLLASRPAPVTVTVDRKAVYDADDMKVQTDGRKLVRIGKELPVTQVDAEAIGVLYVRGDGARLFREGLERAVSTPDPNVRWYLSVVDRLAAGGFVEVVSIEGLEWVEIDAVEDLKQAEEIVAGWEEKFLSVRTGDRPLVTSESAAPPRRP